MQLWNSSRAAVGMVALLLAWALQALPAAAQSPAPAEKPEKPAAAKPAEKAKPEAAKNKAPQKPTTPAAKLAAKPPTTSPAIYTVTTGLIKVEVTLKGWFEPVTTSEVALRLKRWSSLKVRRVVEHGTEVRRGDVLIEFETDKIDQSIADQELALKLAEISLKRAETNLEVLSKITPLNLAATARRKQYAEEDYQRYLKVERPSMVKSAEFSLAQSKHALEYEKEELRQLEKMYRADDLTEETEEIVLKRQRHAVERAEYYLELARQRHEQTLKVELPRLDRSMKDGTTRQQIDAAQSKVLLPLDLERARLELEQSRIQLARQREQLQEMKADREAMVVKAPFDGVVYYGRFVRGKWTGPGTVASKLKPGGSVSSGDTLMTLVKPQPLMVRVNVPEKVLYRLRRGMKATVTPGGFPKVRLNGSISRVSAVPVSDGTFEAQLRVSIGPDEASLVPGMACQVKVVPVLKRRALVVPASAVGTDQIDDQKHYVYRVTDKDKRVKQVVTLGERSGDRVEIVDGLVAGDKILSEYPKNGK